MSTINKKSLKKKIPFVSKYETHARVISLQSYSCIHNLINEWLTYNDK